MDRRVLENMAGDYKGPSYVFDTDEFKRKIREIKNKIVECKGLVFSIKANPFLTRTASENVDFLEVCSPGELSVCERTGVDPGKIIFSGVNKTGADIERALALGVGIFTAESPRQAEMINLAFYVDT